MDRFKFRVWDKALNKYHFDSFVIHPKGFIEFPMGGWDCQGYNDNKNNDYIIEQCTGLCDKNGKLIYEKDRVRVIETCTVLYQPDSDLEQIDFIGVVEWDREGADFDISNDDYCRGFTGKQILEIIGNIHEVTK